MAQPGTTHLELGQKDGLYFEYDAPSQKKPTLVFVNALTGSTATWQAVLAELLYVILIEKEPNA